MSRHQKDGTQGIAVRLKKDWIENGGAYLLALAVLAYYLLFHYKPMVGAVIAFKDFSSSKGFGAVNGSACAISPNFSLPIISCVW